MKFLITALLALTIALQAQANTVTRIKDMSDFEGVRTNILLGYGLVVGLSGTGDSANAIPFTRQSLVSMLGKLGVNAKMAEQNLKMKNVAAVIVTAKMPSFARQGSRLDVSVSSLGDAKSLEGGQLLATPLLAADGETYALAQGSLILGGFTAESNAGSVTKNHTTAGRIADGATVERETGFELSQLERIRIMLRNPDFTTAKRTADAINEAFKEKIAAPIDNGTIDVTLPERYKAEKVAVIQKIENISVKPATNARVVIDEKTGTIVMGENVRISDVAISHSNLTIKVTELEDVVQPNPFAAGDTETENNAIMEVDEDAGKFHIMKSGINLADLVEGLNNLGVKPRDVISILQTIKAAGAMQAEIVLL